MSPAQALILLTLAASICDSLGCVFVDRKQRKTRSFTYIGCYEDRANSRDLFIPGGHGLNMDSNECNSLCRKSQSKYMGLQEAGYCWCGNSFNKYGKKEDSVCSDPCTGDPKEKCGSKDHNSIYETNYT